MRPAPKLIVVAAVLLNFATPSFADFKSGNDLLSDCTADKNDAVYYPKMALCLGYVTGVVDAEDVFGMDKPKQFCVPRGVTGQQAEDIYVAFLQRNPQIRHWTASFTVTLAMMQAFPCRKTK